MAERDPNEFSGIQFCGNCGAAVVPGSTACNQCNNPIQPETDAEVLTGDYIPYCRACGVPVAQEAALNCPKCGVTPLCHEHYYPSTQTCSLCPPFELAPPGERQPSEHADRAAGPWPQPEASIACPKCGARIRQGIQFCANCGAEQEGVQEESEYAGFWIRFGAAVIDSLITGIPAAFITSFTDVPALGTILSVVYYVMFTYAKGQTPGKMMLNLHVVTENGQKPNLKQVIMREVVGKAISALALLIGYLWIIWDPKKRGWHDHIAGTYVVKRERK